MYVCMDWQTKHLQYLWAFRSVIGTKACDAQIRPGHEIGTHLLVTRYVSLLTIVQLLVLLLPLKMKHHSACRQQKPAYGPLKNCAPVRWEHCLPAVCCDLRALTTWRNVVLWDPLARLKDSMLHTRNQEVALLTGGHTRLSTSTEIGWKCSIGVKLYCGVRDSDSICLWWVV